MTDGDEAGDKSPEPNGNVAEHEGNVEQDDARVAGQVDTPLALLGLDRLPHDGAHRARLAVFCRKQLDHLDVAVEVGHGSDNEAASAGGPARTIGKMRHRHHRDGDVRDDPNQDWQRQRPGQRGQEDKGPDKLHEKERYVVEGYDDLLLHRGRHLRYA